MPMDRTMVGLPLSRQNGQVSTTSFTLSFNNFRVGLFRQGEYLGDAPVHASHTDVPVDTSHLGIVSRLEGPKYINY